jgi:hypothetical protein
MLRYVSERAEESDAVPKESIEEGRLNQGIKDN